LESFGRLYDVDKPVTVQGETAVPSLYVDFDEHWIQFRHNLIPRTLISARDYQG